MKTIGTSSPPPLSAAVGAGTYNYARIITRVLSRDYVARCPLVQVMALIEARARREIAATPVVHIYIRENPRWPVAKPMK
jgi:hypothetical protein